MSDEDFLQKQVHIDVDSIQQFFTNDRNQDSDSNSDSEESPRSSLSRFEFSNHDDDNNSARESSQNGIDVISDLKSLEIVDFSDYDHVHSSMRSRNPDDEEDSDSLEPFVFDGDENIVIHSSTEEETKSNGSNSVDNQFDPYLKEFSNEDDNNDQGEEDSEEDELEFQKNRPHSLLVDCVEDSLKCEVHDTTLYAASSISSDENEDNIELDVK